MSKVLKREGVDASTVFRMLAHKIAKDDSVPYEAIIDTRQIRARWDEQAAEALKNGKRYTSAKDLFKDLNQD